MFSIFEYVILVFPKQRNFRGGFEVIHEEIMQIGKSRTTEELSRLWEEKEWRFKRPQEKLFEDEDLKMTKIEEIGLRSTKVSA